MKSRTFLIIGLVAATVIGLTGCGTPDVGLPTLQAAGVQRRLPAVDAPVDAAARGMTALGYQLARTGANPAENWIASPLSIAYAFAIARAGAGGETAAEIDRVFGFPPVGIHDAVNAITRQVVTTERPPPRSDPKRRAEQPQPPVVCVSNALLTQKGLPIGQQFLETLAAQYGVGAHPVDFSSPDTIELINSWVRRQTADRITKLFDRLPADTKLVVGNAVYLHADWAHPFSQSQTGTFTRGDRSTVDVAMMNQQDTLRYAAADGWQAVEVPYAGGEFAMRILLPAPGRPPGDLLAPDLMAAAAAAMRPEDVRLSLPSWRFGTNLELVGVLKQLGVTHAFGDADFSGIHPGLFIDQAIHRANITVDERGTEAAAVTGLSFATSAPAPPQVVMRVDRPFAFAIVHGRTGVPLFVGRVADPTVHTGS